MMYSRYRWARDFTSERRVLEVGCGSGQGLDYLEAQARWIAGGDYSVPLLQEAAQIAPRVPGVALDGTRLPFADGSFDVVLLFEMIYYLSDVADALVECKRVLAPGGVVLVVSANPERPGFNPSPFSHRYLSADEIGSALAEGGFAASLLGNFPLEAGGLRSRAITLAREAASRLHLIPKTMGGKTLLKRLVYGKLQVVTRLTDEDFEYSEPQSIVGDAGRFQVLYAVGQL